MERDYAQAKYRPEHINTHLRCFVRTGKRLFAYARHIKIQFLLNFRTPTHMS